MTDLDQQLAKSFPLDVTGGPGEIMRALSGIENDLALQQLRHAELTGKIKRRQKFMETFTATLIPMLEEGDTITEKKELAKAALHETEEYQEYLEMIEEHATLDKHYDYFDIRRSIGQSILKRMEHDEAKFGDGRGQ